jgi:hypothetical protein
LNQQSLFVNKQRAMGNHIGYPLRLWLKPKHIHWQETATMANKALPEGNLSMILMVQHYAPGNFNYRLQVDNHMLTKMCIAM